MQSTQFLLTPEPNVTYSACLVGKIEEMFETGQGALPGGAHAARQRHPGELPDLTVRRTEAAARRRTWTSGIGRRSNRSTPGPEPLNGLSENRHDDGEPPAVTSALL